MKISRYGKILPKSLKKGDTIGIIAPSCHFDPKKFLRGVKYLKTLGYNVKYDPNIFKKYWSFAPYLGFGPSAHSYIAPDRFWNVRSLKKYIGLLNKGKRPIGDAETLTDEQMMTEAIYLGLRKTDGIDIHAYNQKFNVTFTDQFDEIIKELKKEELIFVNEKRCCLSRKGMLFIDSIVPMFMDNIP